MFSIYFVIKEKKGMPGWNYKTIYIYDWKIKIYNQDHQIFFRYSSTTFAVLYTLYVVISHLMISRKYHLDQLIDQLYVDGVKTNQNAMEH